MIEIAYIIASVASIGAMAPQIRQLLITKKTDELSLLSWTIWAAAQLIATVYAISIHALPFIIMSSMWLFYYACVVSIILYYRHPRIVKRNLTTTSSKPLTQAD